MSVPMMQVYGLQWTGFYLPTEHLGVRKNSLKRVRGFQIELEFGSFSFHGRKKLEYTEKNPSGRRREQTTNSTHIWLRRWDSNPGLIGGRRVFSPLRQPFSFKCNFFFNLMELLNFLIIFLLCQCFDRVSGNGTCICQPMFKGTACELCDEGDKFGPSCNQSMSFISSHAQILTITVTP